MEALMDGIGNIYEGGNERLQRRLDQDNNNPRFTAEALRR
jgi:hypothetical protein